MFVSVKFCSHSQTYTQCRCCRIYEVQMYFRSKVNRGVYPVCCVPNNFYYERCMGLAHEVCQEDLSYETRGIFCYAILCPFFFSNFVESGMLNQV